MDPSLLDRPPSGQDFTGVIHGQMHTFPSARRLSWSAVVEALDSTERFAAIVVGDMTGLSWRDVTRLAGEWRLHSDLPSGDDAHRLAFLVHRFGEAIELDLWVKGIDLAQEWRSRRWRRLLALIDRLPAHSYYGEALYGDDEYLEAMLGDDDRKPSLPPLHMETSELQMLRVVAERLDKVAATIIASVGGKPKKIEPLPRPVTGVQRVKWKRSRQAQQDLEAKLWPNGDG